MNREERHQIALDALADCIEENSSGRVILVEGLKDEKALRALGFTGPIEKLNRGWPVDRVAVHIVEQFGDCIVLMDWDRTGGRLQRRLMDALESLDIKPSDECRRILSRAMKPDTMCVEDLPSFLRESDP